MRPLVFVCVSILLTACVQHSSLQETYVPGLGEIMMQTSVRHAKLWFSGEAGNWALAEYELDELAEGFEDAGKYHPIHKSSSMPLPALIAQTMDKPMQDLRTAIKSKDRGAFVRQYNVLTAACNVCHTASNFSFNLVIKPSYNSFANQSFSPVD